MLYENINLDQVNQKHNPSENDHDLSLWNQADSKLKWNKWFTMNCIVEQDWNWSNCLSMCKKWERTAVSEDVVSDPDLWGRCGGRAGGLTDFLCVPAEHQPPQEDVQH